jgi:hypothetical protein
MVSIFTIIQAIENKSIGEGYPKAPGYNFKFIANVVSRQTSVETSRSTQAQIQAGDFQTFLILSRCSAEVVLAAPWTNGVEKEIADAYSS